MVKLAAMPAGGPHEMTVSADNTITVKDILVGEVWICSGQSNMQWTVERANNPKQETAAADYPKMRLFTVAQTISKEPQEDCTGSWGRCSPETAPSFSAVGYFFGRHLHKQLDVPIGMVNCSWGGTIAEAWTSRETLDSDPDFQAILDRAANFDPKQKNQASVLYNGMLKPLVPLAIRGAIWYQGESNVSRSEQYRELFPAMITDWRSTWKQGDFPFLFVQLAPYRYKNKDPRECAELQEAQLMTLSLPNTGMAVTVDIGNPGDIHPRNKQDVGKRLALWALAKTYGRELVYSGPLYKSMSVEGNKIRLRFKHTGGGLSTTDDGGLTHFTIAGQDGKFVEAAAAIDGNTVLVHSDSVPKPKAVRYAWRDDAVPNLCNTEELPASPFRTDDLPLVTAGKR